MRHKVAGKMKSLLCDVVPRGTASPRGSLEAEFYCLGLGLGLDPSCLGLATASPQGTNHRKPF